MPHLPSPARRRNLRLPLDVHAAGETRPYRPSTMLSPNPNSWFADRLREVAAISLGAPTVPLSYAAAGSSCKSSVIEHLSSQMPLGSSPTDTVRPHLHQSEQACPLLVIQRDRPTRADIRERLHDPSGGLEVRDLSEQCLARLPSE